VPDDDDNDDDITIHGSKNVNFKSLMPEDIQNSISKQNTKE